jgi:hypothetical protein
MASQTPQSWFHHANVSSLSSPIIAGMTDGTPSLGRSDDSAEDRDPLSGPHTPSDRSPFIFGDSYTIPPPMESVTLPHRVGTPTPSSMSAVLPNILDPQTAANVPIRHVCCIGAGYVGMLQVTRHNTCAYYTLTITFADMDLNQVDQPPR